MRTYKVPPKPRTDAGHLELLAHIIFIMGFNYALVVERWPAITTAFSGFAVKKVAALSLDDVLGKPGMIKNRAKISRVIENAKVCMALIAEHGSMAAWVDSVWRAHEENPLFNPSLEEECQRRFAGIGATTREWVAHVFHDASDTWETVRA